MGTRIGVILLLVLFVLSGLRFAYNHRFFGRTHKTPYGTVTYKRDWKSRQTTTTEKRGDRTITTIQNGNISLDQAVLGAPVYPNATVQTSHVDSSTTGTARVSGDSEEYILTTSDSYATVADFYNRRNTHSENNWKSGSPELVMYDFSNDRATINITVQGSLSNDNTTIMIMKKYK